MLAAWFRQQSVQKKLNYKICYFFYKLKEFKRFLITLTCSGRKGIEMKEYKLQAIVDGGNINNDDASNIKMIIVMMITLI